MSESALLPELLGFMPQIVLDDIINYANETSYQGVDAAEEFIRRWLDDREARLGVDPELRREIDSVKRSRRVILLLNHFYLGSCCF